MSAPSCKRIGVGGSAQSINRPRLALIVDGECCIVNLSHGNGNSDPVWYLDVILSGTGLGRLLAAAYWRFR